MKVYHKKCSYTTLEVTAILFDLLIHFIDLLSQRKREYSSKSIMNQLDLL